MSMRSQMICGWVYDVWTNSRVHPEFMADKWFDGCVDALALLFYFKDECCNDADGTNDESSSLPPIPPSGVVRRTSSMSYSEFVDKFMETNTPVVIDKLTESWPASVLFKTDKGQLDIDSLESSFGDSVAPVHITKIADCQSNFGGVSRPATTNMTVGDYCEWFREHQKSEINGSRGDKVERELFYLKDWKFTTLFPNFHLYSLPKFFKEDWLNENGDSSYKFVYLGPKGTATRLHADVLLSYSWSSNVVGRKRWFLVPPQHTNLLFSIFGDLAPHLHADLENGVNAALYPGLKIARNFAIEVLQETGETIFVPSKWYHTVENLADTLSINHNWINGYNIRYSWEKLKIELANFVARVKTIAGEKVGEGAGEDEDEASTIFGDLALLRKIIGSRLERQSTVKDLESIVFILEDLEKMRDTLEGVVVTKLLDTGLLRQARNLLKFST